MLTVSESKDSFDDLAVRHAVLFSFKKRGMVLKRSDGFCYGIVEATTNFKHEMADFTATGGRSEFHA